MKRLSLLIAVFVITSPLFLHAQSVSGKGTRIEYTGPFGAMNATIRATLISGKKNTPLFFEDDITDHPISPRFATKPFMVTPGLRITGNFSSYLHVIALPQGPTRGEVIWCIAMRMFDATTGEALGKWLPTGVWHHAYQPMDTILGGPFKVDLSAFIGRKVHLRLHILVEPEMLEGQQVSIVDITTPQKTTLH